MDQILAENSTSKFFIEYGGFLSNHMPHALIALHRLGADQTRVQKFIKWYEPKLDKKELYPEEDALATGENPDELVGKRRRFYALLNHYQDALQSKYDGNLSKLVASEFPKLSLGLAGSALHGLIHCGYGLSADNSRLTLEGLSYLHHSYMPLTVSDHAPKLDALGQGSMDILDVVEMLRCDEELYNSMVVDSQAESALVRSHGYFQPRVAALLVNHGDRLAEYVQQIKFSPDEHAFRWLVDCALVVYLIAENKNDFFLLHGVTGAWSLLNISSHLDGVSRSDSLRTYLAVLLAAYLAEDRPKLCLDRLNTDEKIGMSWRQIVDKALATEYDEHVYKLVQVCWDMDKINEGESKSELYKKISLYAIENELFLLNNVPRL
ncbi:hypothetical protein CAPTEDRAFT_214401 [Capitella teleta]|uniref:Uncharacterized protein n=1 Tax=Capitella teleta TaxID=283909 RepID=R7TGA7_CAPTE|nr:hypothetical protein CAPTEDRAFT_214401 [Capitella teleta]|eukprot:ELT92798.1 hypothetical protein CAPTEDRAFT_214401 [Capitella teleta]